MSTPQWMPDAGRQQYYYWDHHECCYVYQNGDRIYTDQSLHEQPVLGSVEVGPAEQITEPQALQSGIRAHKRVRATPGEAERLDPRYKKHYPGRDFYTVGKVFKVLWPEPAGNPQSGVTFVTGAYGEQFYNKIRWPIQTYNRQGVEKQGVIKAEHSAIHVHTGYPVPAAQDDPNGEMLQPAIPVVPASREQAKMDPMSRLNYAKPYTVEHNVKSFHFGDVPREWLPILLQNFATVLQSPHTGHRPPAAYSPSGTDNASSYRLSSSSTSSGGHVQHLAHSAQQRSFGLHGPYSDEDECDPGETPRGQEGWGSRRR
ncbi:hypothetical protein BKCO1_19000171 [Neofusicoccum parvum]|uniref:Uncharacterized protein n=1 Tax=Neofusicoccum parvum TaxID=310453 RepID=A0ACB5SN92_9PEZI|nr:hypothetical protein BKCO1_19000171 [Neofusicoccum parvum]